MHAVGHGSAARKIATRDVRNKIMCPTHVKFTNKTCHMKLVIEKMSLRPLLV